MIKVEKIHIEEFRGIRDLTLELSGKNYAVCGPNGTGKSGVVDALEFALTGNISRLSGEGMGNVSVKEHAPHVDSRDNPEESRVTVVLKIPSLDDKQVILTRTVKNASSPDIEPSSSEILAVLSQFEGHPEFVLSRREIIRYVISKPGNRSQEVQALLRLDQVGELRNNLKTISNACEKEITNFKKVQRQSGERLAQALEINEPVKEKILEATNSRRTTLGLAPLKDLTATTILNDGLETNIKTKIAPKVNKTSAIADLKACWKMLQKIGDETTKEECGNLKTELTVLSSNPIIAENVSREEFLRTAIGFVTEESCPVCDTKWDKATLKSLIRAKLQKFEEVTKTRKKIEQRLEPIISLVDEVDKAVGAIEELAKVFTLKHLGVLSTYHASLASHSKALRNFLPITDAIAAIENISTIPENISDIITVIEKAVAAIPEPTQQEAARDDIIRAQDRFETYRRDTRNVEKSKDRAGLAKKIYDIYTDISNKALEGVYKDVQGEFSNLYCAINNEDEKSFTAKLTPSIGKLGFDVDFYGRGHFPPGAYHSEGHQDAMGLCLYLALMRKLQGDNFKFAVLDDVLMSIDADHRREVCNLLKQCFPNTQFVFTTHDEVWLKLMTTVGLITSGNATRFSNWTPDQGPAEWRERDVWAEVKKALEINDVRTAASLLRYYLEYFFREVCYNLRVRIELKGDGRYDLGDTLAPAVRHFRNLIIDGVKVAEAWGQEDTAENLKAKEKSLGDSFIATNAEQWQVNPALHYNEWVNFTTNDFIPVVGAFHDLIQEFFCKKIECAGIFYLTSSSPRKQDAVRCACGNTNINLKKPKNNYLEQET